MLGAKPSSSFHGLISFLQRPKEVDIPEAPFTELRVKHFTQVVTSTEEINY